MEKISRKEAFDCTLALYASIINALNGEEEKLYDYLFQLNDRGIKFGLSNMLYHKGIKNSHLDKLKQFNFHIIQSFQNKAKKKSKTEESVQVFITNY